MTRKIPPKPSTTLRTDIKWPAGTGPGGRPRIINSPEEFVEKVNAYVQQQRERDDPVTVIGMYLSLGFCSFQGFDEYGRRPEYSQLVKWAKSLCQNECLTRIISGQAVEGNKFVLYNMDRQRWQAQTLKVQGNMEVNHHHRVDWSALPDDVLAQVSLLAPTPMGREELAQPRLGHQAVDAIDAEYEER